MTDRELLEAAAKAAGITPPKAPPIHSDGWMHFRGWNPLIDDGDALRLAVALGMHVSAQSVEVWRGGKEVCRIFEDGVDPYSATRRAIVRAAAAMAVG